jgi:hypothetical protein
MLSPENTNTPAFEGLSLGSDDITILQETPKSTESQDEALQIDNQTPPSQRPSTSTSHSIRKNITENTETDGSSVRRSLFDDNLIDPQLHKMSNSLKTMYNTEYEEKLKSYLSEIMNIETSIDIMREKWVVIFTHIIVEILMRICKLERFHKVSKFKDMPENSTTSKSVFITELYNENYNIVDNNVIGIQKMALHPKSRFPIINRFNTLIFCHIYPNRNCDQINVNFYNEGDADIFNDFFNALRTNIDAIIKAYFKKIEYYYIYEPDREYAYAGHLVIERNNIGILTNPCEVQLHQHIIRFMVNENHLKIMETFLKKWHPNINLRDDRIKLCEIWSEFTIDCIKDILTKVFAVTLKNNYHELQFDGGVLSYDMTCAHDIFRNRAKYGRGPYYHGELAKHIGKTIRVLSEGHTFGRPLRAILKIMPDETRNLITMDFYDLWGTAPGNPMNLFIQEFKTRYMKILDTYYDKLLNGFIIFTDNHNYL